LLRGKQNKGFEKRWMDRVSSNELCRSLLRLEIGTHFGLPSILAVLSPLLIWKYPLPFQAAPHEFLTTQYGVLGMVDLSTPQPTRTTSCSPWKSALLAAQLCS
jgi:hypothetical protein